MEHYDIKITGNVQGVSLRLACQKRAQELGLKGFVQNMSDGSVHLEIEGESDPIEKFLGDLENGFGYVDHESLTRNQGQVKSFESFSIKIGK